MARLDKSDHTGNLLAKSWTELAEINPEASSLVARLVDGGELESIGFYVGFGKAVEAIGNLYPEILTSSSFDKQLIYSMMLAYVVYQKRNT